jgi:putative heme-binding domain-containing protein
MEKAGGESVLIRTRRGRPDALQSALSQIADESVDAGQRLQLIQVLGEIRLTNAIPTLLAIVRDSKSTDLRRAALGALQGHDDPRIAADLITQLPAHPADLRPVTLSTLAARPTWALPLLQAIDAARIPVKSVPTDLARKLRALPGEPLATLSAQLWPNLRQPTSAELEGEITRLTEVVNLTTGSPYSGRKLYQESCGSCHRLFAKGADIGPDLTAYQRSDLPNLLLQIVNPNAEIREGYEAFTAEARDGRVLTGFIVEQDPIRILLRTPDGQSVSIARTDLVSLEPAGGSLMPEGLLAGLSDQQVRDLFAYLRSTQPLNE